MEKDRPRRRGHGLCSRTALDPGWPRAEYFTLHERPAATCQATRPRRRAATGAAATAEAPAAGTLRRAPEATHATRRPASDRPALRPRRAVKPRPRSRSRDRAP